MGTMGTLETLKEGIVLEINPSTKEGKELLSSLRFREEDVVEEFEEELGKTKIKVVRIKDYLRTESGLVNLLRHKLIVFTESKGVLKITVKTVADSYQVVRHSSLIEEIERAIFDAGFIPKTYISHAGVSLRAIVEMKGKRTDEDESVSFIVHNSYNYSRAVHINLALLYSGSALYPLWRDILYRKHRQEITSKDFQISLGFVEKILKVLPQLRTISVNVPSVLEGMEGIIVRRWKEGEGGKKELVEIPVGRMVRDEVVKRIGERASVYDTWRTVSEVVFSKDRPFSLSLSLKRKFEGKICELVENYLKSLLLLSLPS